MPPAIKPIAATYASDEQYYEVLEGLEPGERVIVSGYESYKDYKELKIK